MIQGLSAQDHKLIQDLVVVPLKQMNCKVWVFGSRARGDHKKFSDIDLLFEPQLEMKLSTLADIKESLVESNLPYKVDLVDWSELAESYKDLVLKDRIEL